MKNLITKDLMLGNWVQPFRIVNDKKHEHPLMQVVTICETHLYLDIEGNEADPFEYDFNEVEGIPLTKEVLKKCGFKDCKNGDMELKANYITLRKQFHEHDEIEDLFIIQLGWHETNIWIDSLHQLQNLYKILTGKELEIKLR